MSSLRKALEAFADPAQNPDLLRLESMLKRFNLFEAIGVIRQELRHSDLLACLLDPNQYHGLGTAFLKELLQTVLLTAEGEVTIPQSDLGLLNFSNIVVFREWHYIDILVLDEINRLAVIIENKIGTVQGLGQLERYYEDFCKCYPGYKMIALYLTPDGHSPDDERYFAVSYSLICQVIDTIVKNHRSGLDSEIVMVLEHYVQMLRRHILSDTDIIELCQSIYQKHRQALDLIIKYKLDPPAQILQYIKSLVMDEPDLILYSNGKTWVNFSLREWDNSLTARGLSLHTTVFPYLGFSNVTSSLAVGIWVSPGDQSTRQKVLQMAKDNFLTGVSARLGAGDWSRISSFGLLTPKDYDKPQEEIENLISEKWASFLSDELPRIINAVRNEEWLWESP